MKIDLDKDADAAYIYINESGEVDKTIEVNENIILDFDENGRLIGIEMLNASKNLSNELLRSLN